MTFDEVVAAVEASGEIPSLAPVVSELLRQVADPDADFRAVGRTVVRDPALAAKVLRVANSPYHGLRGTVGDVEKAVGLLGLLEVRNIALSVSIISDFSGRFGGQTFNWERFWEHSMGCALIARGIVQRLRLSLGGEEYVGGLLHDVGKILLGHHFPGEFRQVLEAAAGGREPMTEAERRVFGADHGRVGEWLAARWGFPESLRAAIGLHHHPDAAGPHRLLASAIHLADLLVKAKAIGFGGDAMAVCLADDPAWQTLAEARPELGRLDVERFTFELDREVEHARALVRTVRAP
ncbi:MAG: HDOD domain-containing protein [Deferrisomatales bacterium]